MSRLQDRRPCFSFAPGTAGATEGTHSGCEAPLHVIAYHFARA
jgi:hypothetical protein